MLVFGSNSGMDIYAYRRSRLKELVDKEGDGVAAEFARKHNQDATRIRQLLSATYRKGRGFGEGAARNLEESLVLPERYFDLGFDSVLSAQHNSSISDVPISELNTGLIVKSQGGIGNTMGLSNLEPGLEIRGEVPLINWDQARTWDTLMNSFTEADAQRWLPCPAAHSAVTFCIENNTETMDDGTTKGYREGEILFVDPEAPAIPDKDIIVILPNGKMLFRRLKEDSEGPYLLALNGKRIERWEEGTTVRGVVVFSGFFR
jgi:SOS-response transcriptional repressor LexA